MSVEADALLAAAIAAQANAYAPYSNFHVGAAVRVATGAIFAGANVENASYPIGTCAEAGAIAAMVAAGHREIIEVLVVGPGDVLATPCGACRQRLTEFAASDTRVHVADHHGIKQTFRLADLLPVAFGPDLKHNVSR